MTLYNLGDIILIRFPHTDMKSVSKRPALVLYDAGDLEIVIARITTQEYESPFDFKILKWKEAGLLAESYIRVDKLATIEKRYIIRKLGCLDNEAVARIKEIIKQMFKL